MTPEAYRRALLHARPDWAEVERITRRYGAALLAQAVRRAWAALLASCVRFGTSRRGVR